MQPWPKRLPGSAVSRTNSDVPSASSAAVQRANVRVAAKSRSRKRKAAAPSTSAQSSTKKRVRSSCAPRLDCTETSAVAQRLATGRSCENYVLLLHTSLLSPVDKVPAQTLPAVRGLTAMRQGQPVFVLDSFMFRGCHKNDVANIRQLASGECILGDVVTCKSSELSNLRLQYEVTSVARGRVTLKKCCSGDALPVVNPEQAVHRLRAMADEAAQAVPARPLAWMSANPEPLSLRSVKPQAASEHERQFPHHRVQPRQDRQRFEFCLDVPCPQIWDMTPWRCRSCDSEIWPVTAADVDGECLRLRLGTPLRFTETRHGKVSASPLLLFWLLLMLYRDMNLHEVRRKLLDLYSASTLHAAQITPSLSDVSQLRWILMCVPDHHAIKDILLSCFADFVQKRVDLMQERQFVYNGQLIRGDGNYDLAKAVVRYVEGKKSHPYTVALAWCGVDGSLLVPVSLAQSESWHSVEASLAPLLQKLKQARLRAGFSLEDSIPCFHATDSYHKHRQHLCKLYGSVWKDLRVEGQTPTRCKDAFCKVGVVSEEASQAKWLLRVTGEPMHDLFALRRLASPAANDCHSLLADHERLILRLNAPAPPTGSSSLPVADDMEISPGAQDLLQRGVKEPAASAADAVAASPTEAAELRALMATENVQQQVIWHTLFNAAPPQGVLGRISRLLGASLPAKHAELYNFLDKDDFVDEVRRMEAWYQRPRRESRRRRGILRGNKQSEVKGRAKVWTTKVAAHYARMRAPIRLQGFMRWREAALALHAAGIEAHSGTVPVERLWANIGSFIAAEATNVSEAWWTFLANLSDLRFNYRHFHKRGLPGWAREDTLVHEQVEGIMKLAEAVLFGGGDSLAAELEEWAATVRHGGEVPVLAEPDAKSHDAGLEERAATVQHGGEVPVLAETEATSHDDSGRLQVYCRMLRPVWCEALASGEKMFEVQRYKQKRGGNVFKFAKAGDWVLFGAAGSDQVAGVAVLAGPAARRMKATEIEARAERLPERLRPPFCEYMAEGVEFDLVEVQSVYDLRPLNLAWRQLSKMLQCKISRNIGFTKVRLQMPEAMQKLRNLVAEAKVIARRVECST